MKPTPASVCVAALLGVVLLSFSAPAQQPAAASEPVLRSNTDEVVLDLIIRDKHGKGAREVEPADLQILDNGVPRKINSFRLVEGKEALSKTGNVTLDPLRQIRLVTLVFERLGVDGRRFARSAALDLVKTELGPNVFYSVFTIDQHLSALQPFTNDRDKLRKAIEHATNGAYSEYTSASERIKHDLESQLGAG